MIAWVVEPNRFQAVFLDPPRSSIEIGNAEVTAFLEQGEWYLHLPRGTELVKGREIAHGRSQVFAETETGKTASICYSIYQNGYDRFQKYETGKRRITIGSSIDDDLYLQDDNLKPHHIEIDPVRHDISDCYDSGLVELNGTRLRTSAWTNGSMMRTMNLQILLHDDFLMVNHPENLYLSLSHWKPSEGVLNIPQLSHLLSRSFRRFPDALLFEAELREPLPYTAHMRQSLVFIMGPALLMASASLSAGLISAYSGWLSGRELYQMIPSILLPCVMMLSVLIFQPLQRFSEQRRERKEKTKREEDYKSYLQDLEQTILDYERKVSEDTELLYTPLYEAEEIYPALPENPDYLTVCAGRGKVRFDLHLSSSTRFQANDPIPEWIDDMKTRLAEYEMPVPVCLRNVRRAAISYTDRDEPVLLDYLFQLLFRSGPDLFKLVVLSDEEQLCHMEWLKEIPHVRLSEGTRLFARTISEALELCQLLKQNAPNDIVILALKPSLLEAFRELPAHAILLYRNLPLPADSDLRIQLSEEQSFYESGKHQQFVLNRPDNLDPWKLCQKLNSLKFIDTSHECMRNPGFFDLYQADSSRGLNIEERWNRNHTRSSLEARIGFGEDGEPMILDLHERGCGPHGLIAGMTGSGKSEFLICAILSLCVNYSPREFQFVMIDFKGGGSAQLFVNDAYQVPHAAGVLSNLELSGMERALVSFQKECHRRETLFQKMSSILNRPVMNLSAYQTEWREDMSIPYLASLLIIVDEFAELKKERPDFMRDLISIARVGRSLGMHMILSTQKPSGIVDEQIWSNTRFKICLKVQEKQDSSEMIHAPDAAWIQRPGEFYLLSDGMMRHGWGGYANAGVTKQRQRVALLNAMGYPEKEIFFGESSPLTQAQAVLREILSLKNAYPTAEPLWLEPLGSITVSDLPDTSHIWLGRLDDYYERRQPFLSFDGLRMAVFSIDRKEKIRLVQTILYGLFHTVSATDELYVIDDLFACSEWLTEAGPLCRVFTSSNGECLENLFRHIESRDSSAVGTVTLLLTDVSAFYGAGDAWRPRLHNLIELADQKRIRLILCFANAGAISYRDLSLINLRVALRNENEQDLSSIFERPVHRTVPESGRAIVSGNRLLELSVTEVSETELKDAYKGMKQRCGTAVTYAIPEIPSVISYAMYPGDGIGLGIGMESYAWVDVKPKDLLIVLATYEEELYAYYDVFCQVCSNAQLNPETLDVPALIQSKQGGVYFMTLDQFQTYYVPNGSAAILYLGRGFQDQYRFTAGKRKPVKENQGVFYRTGRNQVIQVFETIG